MSNGLARAGRTATGHARPAAAVQPARCSAYVSIGGAKPPCPAATSAGAGFGKHPSGVCVSAHDRSASRASASISSPIVVGRGAPARTCSRTIVERRAAAVVVPSARRATSPESHRGVTRPNQVYTYTRAIRGSRATSRNRKRGRARLALGRRCGQPPEDMIPPVSVSQYRRQPSARDQRPRPGRAEPVHVGVVVDPAHVARCAQRRAVALDPAHRGAVRRPPREPVVGLVEQVADDDRAALAVARRDVVNRAAVSGRVPRRLRAVVGLVPRRVRAHVREPLAEGEERALVLGRGREPALRPPRVLIAPAGVAARVLERDQRLRAMRLRRGQVASHAVRARRRRARSRRRRRRRGRAGRRATGKAGRRTACRCSRRSRPRAAPVPQRRSRAPAG